MNHFKHQLVTNPDDMTYYIRVYNPMVAAKTSLMKYTTSEEHYEHDVAGLYYVDSVQGRPIFVREL